MKNVASKDHHLELEITPPSSVSSATQYNQENQPFQILKINRNRDSNVNCHFDLCFLQKNVKKLCHIESVLWQCCVVYLLTFK